jgi:hypothetical protein
VMFRAMGPPGGRSLYSDERAVNNLWPSVGVFGQCPQN